MVDEIALESEEYTDNGSTTAVAQFCMDLFTEYDGSSYRKRKLDEIELGRKRYDNDRPKSKSFPFQNASNKSLGLEAIAVDNLEPRLYNKLIGEEEFIQVKPTQEEDAESVPQVKEFMTWATIQNMDIKTVIKPVCHDLLMDGTKDVLSIWDEKEVITRIRGRQPTFEDLEGNEVVPPPGILQAGDPEQVLEALITMGIRPSGSKEGFKERPRTDFKVKLVALTIEDCYFPDHNNDWEEQPFLRKIYPSLGELVKLQKKGVYKNIINALVRGARRDTTDDEQRKDVQYSDYGQETELLECYIKWEGDWRIVTVAPDAGWVEVRNQPLIDIYWSNKKPIKRFTIYPKSNESMGTGVPKKIDQFSFGMNDLYNQMIDAGTIEIIPYYFFNSSSTGMTSAKKHNLYPGAGVPLPKDSQVTFPNVGGRSAMFIQFINLLLTFFERTLSIMDFTQGTRSATTGQGGDTASGMNMILQEGNIKHNYTGEHVQDTFGKILTDVLSLYAQNIPMTAKMRIFSKNQWLFSAVDVDALQGSFDIAIDVSDSSANTMTNRNEKLTLANSQIELPWTDGVQLSMDIYKAFGIKDADKYIKPGFQMLSQALTQAPELAEQFGQLTNQFMQQQRQQQRVQELDGQAEDNVLRQQRQRIAEKPTENFKLVDRSNEKFKTKVIDQTIEAIGGLNELEPNNNQTQGGVQ